jgi:hypothetical protein
MTYEEIKARAKKIGLDPAKLIIYEPWYDAKLMKANRYRLEYRNGDQLLAWNFCIERVECDLVDCAIEYYVDEGLKGMRERLAI